VREHREPRRKKSFVGRKCRAGKPCGPTETVKTDVTPTKKFELLIHIPKEEVTMGNTPLTPDQEMVSKRVAAIAKAVDTLCDDVLNEVNPKITEAKSVATQADTKAKALQDRVNTIENDKLVKLQQSLDDLKASVDKLLKLEGKITEGLNKAIERMNAEKTKAISETTASLQTLLQAAETKMEGMKSSLKKAIQNW
jgi:DNA anti-recombination protein RmuC